MNRQVHVRKALEHLGNSYTTKTIDMELCVYKKLNEKHDIEISYCSRNLGNGTGYRAFLWETQDRMRIVDRMPRYTKDLDELKTWLDERERDLEVAS